MLTSAPLSEQSGLTSAPLSERRAVVERSRDEPRGTFPESQERGICNPVLHRQISFHPVNLLITSLVSELNSGVCRPGKDLNIS